MPHTLAIGKRLWARYFNRGWPVLFSLLYAAIMLSFSQHSSFYSQSPYHRQQAAALMRGHLCLSESIDDLQLGLAWHDGKVQQVWGLGVGMWLLPFQVLWKLLGRTDFPDRIALGIAFALLSLYTTGAGSIIAGRANRTRAVGLVWLVLLCPGLWTLSRVSEGIFEQTNLYALIVSLGIFVSIVRVIYSEKKRDVWICAMLCALGMWIRPTHAVYGLIGILMLMFILWQRRRSLKGLSVIGACWIISATLLAGTNSVRFGSPTEFGHRLTVSTENMVYLTRFGNPFEKTSAAAAAKELVGMLFLSPGVQGANAFSSEIVPGQAPVVRWRRMDLTTYDITWGVLCLLAIGTGVFSLRKLKGISKFEPKNVISVFLLFFGGGAAFALGVFYLYYPAMASRYLFDFAPAFIALAYSIWWQASSLRPQVSLAILAVWLVYEVASARIPNDTSIPAMDGPNTPRNLIPISAFQGSYTTTNHPTKIGKSYNGYGWEPDTGFAGDVVSIAVDCPRFLELVVGERRASYGQVAREDTYRAQIDGIGLSLRSVGRAGDDGVKTVLFEIPEKIRRRNQTEVVFLCFSDGYDTEDRSGERFLYSIRWR